MHLYHGTTLSNFIQMCSDQSKEYVNILPSLSGQMGPGIYLTTLEEAFIIADHRGSKEDGAVVLKIAVNLGKIFEYSDSNIGTPTYITSLDQSNKDSATSIHPRWAGVEYPFREWVIKDNHKMRVIDVWLIRGQLYDKLIVPKANVYLMPEFKANFQKILGLSVVRNYNTKDLLSGTIHKNVSSPGVIISLFLSYIQGNVQQSTEVRFEKVQNQLFFTADWLKTGELLFFYYDGLVYKGSKICHKSGILYHPLTATEANKEKPFYQGEFKDNQMHGRGVLFYEDHEFDLVMEYGKILFLKSIKFNRPGGETVIYESSQLKNYKEQCNIGTIIYPNGEKYKGELKDKIPHGWGEYFNKDGSFYVGLFNEGKKQIDKKVQSIETKKSLTSKQTLPSSQETQQYKSNKTIQDAKNITNTSKQQSSTVSSQNKSTNNKSNQKLNYTTEYERSYKK
eukprot:403330886